MKIHRVLFFSFLAALHGANTQSMITTKTEGEDFRDSFRVDRRESSGLYLYKNNSGKEEVIIQTFGRRAQSGRHTLRRACDGELFVVITELALSDAGQYGFGVSNSSSQGSFKTFELRIKERCGVDSGEPKAYSIPDGGTATIRCSLSAAEQNKKFLCREECKKVLIETTDVAAKSGRYGIKYESRMFFNVSITQLSKSDSGRYRCGVGRVSEKNMCQEFRISVTSNAEGATVPVVVSLVVMVLLAALLLLLYRWKIGRTCSYLKCRRHSSSTNTEFVPHDNSAHSSTLEDPTYDTVDSPSTYQILNQPNPDQHEMYSTLGQ